MKKFISLILACVMLLSLVAGCGSKTPGTDDNKNTTIKVAVVENGFTKTYPAMWDEITAAFEAETGIKVELQHSQNLEDEIGPAMQNGEYPDVIYLPEGRPSGLTEQFIKGNLMADISAVLDMKIPGEEAKVSDKIQPAFLETSKTMPYGDGKTYMMPMHYDPCGLFYNAGLLKAHGWELPTTWDEMWELGEKAKAEGISLFTYPTTGYFDAFLYALTYAVGGPEFFDKVTHYEDVWDTAEAKTLFGILDKLASYTNPVTPAQANDQDFTQNQQLVLDNKAIFMPNGTWVTGEMADAPRADGFEWGMTAIPAVTEGGDAYSFCWFQQAWIPAGAANVDAGEQFIAFLYSDKAADIFAKGGAIQPINGMVDKLEGEKKMFFSIYDDAKPAMGGFATYEAVAGLGTPREVFLDPMNALVSGNITMDDYINGIKTAAADMHANLK